MNCELQTNNVVTKTIIGGVPKKSVLKNFVKFPGKHLCWNLFFNKVASMTPTQVFSSEFCEIFKNTFFPEHLRQTASVVT